MDTRIKKITARQLIDCERRPMVEVDVVTNDGCTGRASAPTGSSVGMYEAAVLRDGDDREYKGMSVHKAVSNVEDVIAPALIGVDVTDQRAVDRILIELDGTANKSRLGGNAVYGVSSACLRAAASAAGMPVYRYIAGHDIQTGPVPSFNMVNGGKGGNIHMAFNEFLLVPYKACCVEEAVEIGVLVFQALNDVISEYQAFPSIVGHSFGWAAPSDDPAVVLGLMQKAAEKCGFADKVAFAIDCASSEVYDERTETYLLKGKRVDAPELIEYVKGLADRVPLVFVEDLLDENDWAHYPAAVNAISHSLIIGDDFIVTNLERLKRAHEQKCVEGFILKPNQVGTITEALDAYAYAKKEGLLAITSGRAGGVVDDIVMDLAVGLQIPLIKNGAPRSGERIEKLNFLLRVASLYPECKLSDLSRIIKF